MSFIILVILLSILLAMFIDFYAGDVSQAIKDSKAAYLRDAEVVKFYTLDPDVDVTYDNNYGADADGNRGVSGVIDEINMSLADIYSALTIEMESSRSSSAFIKSIGDFEVNLNLSDWINEIQLNQLETLFELDYLDGNIKDIDQKIFLILARDDSDYFLKRVDQVG